MAAGAMPPRGEGPAQDPLAAAWRDDPKLLDVDLHQLAWLLADIEKRPPGARSKSRKRAHP